jgi:hypothetical protein
LITHQVSIQQYIEVGGSRPPSDPAFPAETVFDRLAHFQEVPGGPVRLQDGYGIDEIFLLMTPNRLGVIKRGDTNDPAGL